MSHSEKFRELFKAYEDAKIDMHKAEMAFCVARYELNKYVLDNDIDAQDYFCGVSPVGEVNKSQ